MCAVISSHFSANEVKAQLITDPGPQVVIMWEANDLYLSLQSFRMPLVVSRHNGRFRILLHYRFVNWFIFSPSVFHRVLPFR